MGCGEEKRERLRGDGDDDDDDDDDALVKTINFRVILPPSRTIRRMGSRSTV